MMTNLTIPPTRKTIEIRITSLHWEKCRAFVYGQLAVTRYPTAGRRWIVAHVMSGAVVAWTGRDYRVAHEFACQCEGLYDFDAGYLVFEKTGEWPDRDRRKAVLRLFKHITDAAAPRGESDGAE